MPKIVMVDDDANLLRMTEMFLTALGWGFRGAKDGASGLALIAAEKPDLVLMDVNLPDTDGFELCSRLKRDPSTRAIPLILISGEKKKAEDILAGLEEKGADCYLVKPVALPVLKSKIEAVLKPFQAGGAG